VVLGEGPEQCLDLESVFDYSAEGLHERRGVLEELQGVGMAKMALLELGQMLSEGEDGGEKLDRLFLEAEQDSPNHCKTSHSNLPRKVAEPFHIFPEFEVLQGYPFLLDHILDASLLSG
jgi:hypothetical protein